MLVRSAGRLATCGLAPLAADSPRPRLPSATPAEHLIPTRHPNATDFGTAAAARCARLPPFVGER